LLQRTFAGESGGDRDGRVEDGHTGLQSSEVTGRSITRFAVKPRCGARRAVCGPENHHQAEARPRTHQPPPESPFNQNAAQTRIGHAEDVKTRCQGSEAVNEEEQMDKGRNDRKKAAPGLSREESFAKVEGAANPENLAGNKHHQDGEEEQVKEVSAFVGVYYQESSKSKNQKKRSSDYER
jgi:hypothetical protein